MDLSLIADNWQLFAKGVGNTLSLVALSLVAGFLLAVPLALCQAYTTPVLGKMATGYSYLVRGTPLLIQAYLIYNGLAQFEFVRSSVAWIVLKDAYSCALVAFSLNSAAYISEILRGAIISIPKGLHEAAKALGLRPRQAFWLVTLPIALRRSIPAGTNEVIFLLHASVIASTITIVDILGAGRELNNKFYVTYEGFVTAALLYLVIVFVLTKIAKSLEQRFPIGSNAH